MSAPTFKECIAQDIYTTYLNQLEFADEHIINGKPMAAIVDENELQKRDQFKLLGAIGGGTEYKATRFIFVAKKDFGPRPALGVNLNLDGREYRVVEGTTEEAGLLAIALERIST